jgi:hypothetical protein
MAKRPLRLSARIPPYRPPRNHWRTLVHRAISAYQRAAGVTYDSEDKLHIQVRLYLGKTALRFHDVDNRLKDIMDALQGRVGGPKRITRLKPIIPNDRQIYKVEVEKCPAPPQSRGLGHLIIRRYKEGRRLRSSRRNQ